MSTSATKRKAEEPEQATSSKKQKVVDDEESGSEEEGSGEEDELNDLIQDQEDQADGRTYGRRTRGVKIDFTGKDVPGEGDDDEDDEENVPEVEEEVSDQDIKVLKLGTVLDNTLPTNSFLVSLGAQSVPFISIQVQVSMHDLTEDSFVAIPAGKSVSATRTNLAALYSFDFAPKQDLQVADANSVVTDRG
ncbi:SubName: Full=Uncharacterized protein {ECO:0000313/EMBL:CCA75683.1} [Serendipita indica DSM 11827]|nr:SubName: Full=Uncharacterized protein {ECO:0000313/EMBL:CCA75683.1} [Serendipita indica DSM 11827]